MQMLIDCDMIENDIIKFIWQDMDVSYILDNNRVKYLAEFGQLP